MGLPYTFVKIIHLTEELLLSLFSWKIYFANSVLFSYFSCLKSLMWFLYLSLKVVSAKFFFIIWVINDICSIYNWWSLTLTNKWAFILYPTVASKWLLLCWQNVRFVWRYDRTNVPQAAITCFDCISIKYLVHGMISWKMFWNVLMLLFTLLEKGGLTHIISLFLFFVGCWCKIVEFVTEATFF